jgi:hypothetical protein
VITEPVVLVDAPYIGTDYEIVIAVEIRPGVNRLGGSELEFDLATPIIHVAIGLGDK